MRKLILTVIDWLFFVVGCALQAAHLLGVSQ